MASLESAAHRLQKAVIDALLANEHAAPGGSPVVALHQVLDDITALGNRYDCDTLTAATVEFARVTGQHYLAGRGEQLELDFEVGA